MVLNEVLYLGDDAFFSHPPFHSQSPSCSAGRPQKHHHRIHFEENYKKEAMCIIQIDAIQPKWILIAHSDQRTNKSEQIKHALLSERMTESISMGGRVQNHNQKRQRLTSDFR